MAFLHEPGLAHLWTHIIAKLGNKVDKVDGKGLSTNDFTTEEKNKLAGISAPKLTTVSLPTSSWVGKKSPWSQEVTVNGVTANSRLELCPTAEQIVDLQASEITLMLQNDSGTVTAWAINNKPTSDLTLQVLITEVIPV